MHRQSKQSRTEHDERGAALSILLIGTVVLILLAAGLIVDGGRKYDAVAAAQAGAAAAARAGSNAVAKQSIAGAPVDVSTATSAAQDYLTRAGLHGTVQVQGQEIVVSATQDRDTAFLAMVGIGHVSGTATAQTALFDPAAGR